MREFPMQDFNKKSLLKRVIAWEKKSYECAHPIVEKKTTYGMYKALVVYIVKMRKVL